MVWPLARFSMRNYCSKLNHCASIQTRAVESTWTKKKQKTKRRWRWVCTSPRMGNTHGTIHNELTHHLCENMLCFFVQLSMVISLTVGKSHGHYSIALYVETKMMSIFSSSAGCCAVRYLHLMDSACFLFSLDT